MTLPPVAPGYRLDQGTWTDGAWRIISRPQRLPSTPTPGPNFDQIVRTPQTQTIAVRDGEAKRILDIDAFDGVADEVHLAAGARQLAVYQPGRGNDAGVIEVRGPGWTSAYTPTIAPLGLSWSPRGNQLIAFLDAGSGVSVLLLDVGTTKAHTVTGQPIVALPGRMRWVSWAPSGDAALVAADIPAADGRTTNLLGLTLITVRDGQSTYLGELPIAAFVGGVPHAWSDTTIYWTDADHRLNRAALTGGLAEQLPLRDVYGIKVEGTLLRLVQLQRRSVVLTHATLEGTLVQTDAVLDDVRAPAGFAALWQGDQLLLMSPDEWRLLDFRATSPAAAQSGAQPK